MALFEKRLLTCLECVSHMNPRWKVLAAVTLVAALVLAVAGCRPSEEQQLPETSAELAPVPPEPEPVRADVNGTKLYYEVEGEGPPLVLISGASLDARMWDWQVEEFSQGHQVIRYDPRGIGRSELPDGPFSHSADLFELLKFLNVETATLLGFSFGGGVAIDFALAHPDMVDVLLLVAPGLSSWKDETAPALAALSEVARQEGEAEAIEMILQDPSMPPAEQAEARGKIRQILSDNPELLRSGFSYLALMQPIDPPPDDRLGEIQVPTLLVVGERDHPRIHENVDQLQRSIIGAKKVLIMGVGHVINLENPDELNRIVLDFLPVNVSLER
jgi:pimeloyl-ACP methyl ester carboxylesterase